MRLFPRTRLCFCVKVNAIFLLQFFVEIFLNLPTLVYRRSLRTNAFFFVSVYLQKKTSNLNKWIGCENGLLSSRKYINIVTIKCKYFKNSMRMIKKEEYIFVKPWLIKQTPSLLNICFSDAMTKLSLLDWWKTAYFSRSTCTSSTKG